MMWTAVGDMSCRGQRDEEKSWPATDSRDRSSDDVAKGEGDSRRAGGACQGHGKVRSWPATDSPSHSSDDGGEVGGGGRLEAVGVYIVVIRDGGGVDACGRGRLSCAVLRARRSRPTSRRRAS